MFKELSRKLAAWRRRQHIDRIRREFAGCGYPVDHLDDLQIEWALTGGDRPVEEVMPTGTTIYFALRRL